MDRIVRATATAGTLALVLAITGLFSFGGGPLDDATTPLAPNGAKTLVSPEAVPGVPTLAPPRHQTVSPRGQHPSDRSGSQAVYLSVRTGGADLDVELIDR